MHLAFAEADWEDPDTPTSVADDDYEWAHRELERRAELAVDRAGLCDICNGPSPDGAV
jgi:hypothetical protein